jgi:hypothetical protein
MEMKREIVLKKKKLMRDKYKTMEKLNTGEELGMCMYLPVYVVLRYLCFSRTHGWQCRKTSDPRKMVHQMEETLIYNTTKIK